MSNIWRSTLFGLVRQNSTKAGYSSYVSPKVVELRVGRIIEVRKHENADRLYVSKVQIAEHPQSPKYAQVCSGLVDHIPIEAMLHSRVCLVTNLKPSKMRGIKSEAMLLAATNTDGSKVEIVNPPRSIPLGTLLYFEGHKNEHENSTRLSSSQWKSIAENLHTDSNGNVVYGNEQPLLLRNEINDDPCTVRTLTNCKVR
ncbi:hypothetical protein KL921_002501 [Ogataea angusta]|uniref:tRNA-binding domain-containing protein n=1 Tax=Pichia angusta TaxID=870730 RepID=A0ABQ7RXP5_PICAN|nr:hypothetical protein KL921_002501 [Ogataea angusta]KAG7824032.1 hypothetical protein KL909_002769 [Ogataea angusta]KAG7838585.1 hypothetical protein KL943_000661 [Ogataea angusta]KAG7841001.1 hypothetical protein KL942_001989 [Ogataea angusta]KAG7847041.1 hypothetical protein KL941_002834 [Ogataea angusta]